MLRTTLLPCLLIASLVACQDDDPAPADAAPGSDTPPRVDDAEPDTDDQPPASGPRVYQITAEHTDDLVAGDMTAARVGDWVIRNDHVRFVIRGGETGLYAHGAGGGGIVDAGDPATDRIQEIMPIMGFGSLSGAPEVTILQNGEEGVAELSVSSPTGVPDLVGAYLLGVYIDASITQTYRVEAGATALEITTALEGPAARVEQIVGDVTFLGGELEITYRKADGWLAADGPVISYGLTTDLELDVLALGGLTVAMGPSVSPPVEWTRWLVVGDGSLSSVVDQMIDLRMSPAGRVSGTVSDPAARVAARDPDGNLVSRFTPDAEGAFSGLLPAGLFSLTAEGAGRPTGAPVEVDVTDGAEIEGLSISAEAAGALRITVEGPARLDVQGATHSDLVPLGPGETVVGVPPGEYTLTASRGFEYEIAQTTVTIEADGEASWAPTLERSVDTAGWIASDFHLHSEWSTDSNVPLRDRIRACAAEGIEYAVSTDHDIVTDYRPYVAPELDGLIRVANGCEVTTMQYGHINVFPLEFDPDRAGRGSFSWFGKDFAEVMDMLSPETEGRVVQINHGRSSSSGTLNAIGYDPADPDPATLELMRFNAMELFNGGGGGFDELVIDWLGMLDQGLQVAATGVSDSHSIGALCGHARTWVEAPDSDLAALDTTDIDAAVLAGRTLVSSGPFATLAEGAEGAEGAVHVRIQAPTHMPVDRFTVWADGVVDSVVEVPASAEVLRFDDDVALANADAKNVVVVVEADTVPGPALKRKIRAVTPVLRR